MTVSFDALMKELKVKSLCSGDKSGRLLLEFRVDNEHDDLVSSLNRLMRADEEIQVTISR